MSTVVAAAVLMVLVGMFLAASRQWGSPEIHVHRRPSVTVAALAISAAVLVAFNSLR